MTPSIFRTCRAAWCDRPRAARDASLEPLTRVQQALPVLETPTQTGCLSARASLPRGQWGQESRLIRLHVWCRAKAVDGSPSKPNGSPSKPNGPSEQAKRLSEQTRRLYEQTRRPSEQTRRAFRANQTALRANQTALRASQTAHRANQTALPSKPNGSSRLVCRRRQLALSNTSAFSSHCQPPCSEETRQSRPTNCARAWLLSRGS